MTQEQDMAIKNCILKIHTGSYLYGTNTPESDEDYIGIFIPDPIYLLGIKHIEQVDLSTKSKDESGKNTNEANDTVFYTLEKFVRLALDNNPNILEVLFVNPENILYYNEIGKQLLSLRPHFLAKGAIKQKYLSFAFSQKQKMIMKVENYDKLTELLSTLKENTISCTFLNEIDSPLFERKGQEIILSDITLPANSPIKKAIKVIEKRVNRYGSRTILMTKYGMDTKFASNLIRLLYEGLELLEFGELRFPLVEADTILEIKQGKWKLEQVLELAEDLEKMVEQAYDNTFLPTHPNRKLIEDWLFNIYKQQIIKEK
jgi:predicted nucleotidyltransferase